MSQRTYSQMLLSVSTMLFFLCSAAFAQQKAALKKPEPPARDSVSVAVRNANSDLERLKKEFADEIKKADGFDICTIQVLRLQQKYATWFLEHSGEFKKFEQQIDSAFSQLMQKAESLKSENIAAIPVKGQGEVTKSVSFDTLLDYLRNFNGRIKTCAPNKLQLLIRAQEDPELNPQHVVHSQIVGAMETMTGNLNASLKESGSKFRLEFLQTNCGYDLVLNGQFDVRGQNAQSFSMSLLKYSEGGAATASLWETLYSSDQKIDQYSVSGMARFQEMYAEMITPECASKAWTEVRNTSLSTTMKPYVAYREASTEIERMAARDQDKDLQLQIANVGGLSPHHYCTKIMQKIHPTASAIEITTLCGAAVPDAAPATITDVVYARCISSAFQIDPKSKGRIGVVASKCRQSTSLTLTEKTLYLPPALYCMYGISQVATGYREEDLQWLCGVSANTLVAGHANNAAYAVCIVEKVKDGVRDGNILTSSCAK